MKLENQVCTLEQAKILKDEFGLELESYWIWMKKAEGFVLVANTNHAQKFYEYYPAPSCAEIGVLLPHSIIYGGSGYVLFLEKTQIQWSCYYAKSINRMTYLFDQTIEAEHTSHAKADLLIDGLREGYIKPEELKL